ncbi:hypothetical protein G6011_11815 [Alternaria panax]|uniref:Heterokaryon incompatibility domain-containing protein n=1 Tax=Alternaria panax TaxID=48097 RepID=A0AAD4F8R5_9PLEO|nr:hypothetical protein G6011_11815 [Alternaria panax]
MVVPERPKQSILKKTFGESFRFQKLRRKSTAPASPPATPDQGDEDPLGALPLLQYGSLDPSKKSVRLLEVLPAPDHEPIQANLSLCDLDDKPENNPAFIALSYTWDPKDGEKRYVNIQGSKFAVGLGLWSFLQQYRRKQYLRQCCEKNPPKALPLWIDAVAIDQTNIPERNYQVSLMRDVYTGARSVIVWLGLPHGSEELAFMLARRPGLLRVEEFYAALADVLNKPYWSRVWVIQEFVLAQSVEIWCGDLQVDAAVVESIWRNGLTSTPVASATNLIYTSRGYKLFKSRKEFKCTKKYRREVLGRRNSKTLKSTFRLRDLLQDFATSESSVVYDRVYGFLGVASDGCGERIVPDYNKQPVELLVDVLRNQCHEETRRGDSDDYRFLTFLMQALDVSRETLAQHILNLCPDLQPHLYILAATPCVSASLSFISTITEVGEFVDHDEAFQPGSWKAGWTTIRSNMHPRSFSPQDILDLGEYVRKDETQRLLSFADPHVPYGNPGPTEKVRQAMIEASADLVIGGLSRAIGQPERDSTTSPPPGDGGSKVLRNIVSRSMTDDAAALYMAARSKLARRNTDQRHARYTSFVGTNGITGLACSGGPGSYEIGPNNWICIFSGVTDTNNAFILRFEPNDDGSDGKWLISGSAVILLPELRTPSVLRTGTGATTTSNFSTSALSRKQTLRDDMVMCFHCHLSDLLELQRCQLLSAVQMSFLMHQTLRGEAEGKTHRCHQGTKEHVTLEFGL